jgi:tetratricopeptide (TPR) repeat protein
LPTAIKPLFLELQLHGYDKAFDTVRKLQKTRQLQFSEKALTTWGYQLLSRNKAMQALEIFKLNTQLFPNSANTYDCLAENYAVMGNKPLAIRFYQKVLELKPDNRHAKAQIKKLQTGL